MAGNGSSFGEDGKGKREQRAWAGCGGGGATVLEWDDMGRGILLKCFRGAASCL
jgi:hypothetical protein